MRGARGFKVFVLLHEHLLQPASRAIEQCVFLHQRPGVLSDREAAAQDGGTRRTQSQEFTDNNEARCMHRAQADPVQMQSKRALPMH